MSEHFRLGYIGVNGEPRYQENIIWFQYKQYTLSTGQKEHRDSEITLCRLTDGREGRDGMFYDILLTSVPRFKSQHHPAHPWRNPSKSMRLGKVTLKSCYKQDSAKIHKLRGKSWTSYLLQRSPSLPSSNETSPLFFLHLLPICSLLNHVHPTNHPVGPPRSYSRRQYLREHGCLTWRSP